MYRNKKPREDLVQLGARMWRLNFSKPHDNGDKTGNDSNFMAMAMSDLLALKHPATEEQLDNFEVELLRLVMIPRKWDHSGGGMSCKRVDVEWDPDDHSISFDNELGSDYGPTTILLEAMTNAGLDKSICPYKTWMTIRADHVSAAFGNDMSKNFYPLGDGRVLLNSMAGDPEDSKRMVELAIEGSPIGEIVTIDAEYFKR